MKVQVVNISSGLVAVPAPISITLAAGKMAVVSLSDPDWRAVQTSPAFSRLFKARMLSVTPMDAPVAPAPEPAPAPAPEPAPTPEVKVEEPPAPAPEVKVEESPEPVAPEEPTQEVAMAVEPEPAPDAKAEEEEDKPKKRKRKAAE